MSTTSKFLLLLCALAIVFPNPSSYTADAESHLSLGGEMDSFQPQMIGAYRFSNFGIKVDLGTIDRSVTGRFYLDSFTDFQSSFYIGGGVAQIHTSENGEGPVPPGPPASNNYNKESKDSGSYKYLGKLTGGIEMLLPSEVAPLTAWGGLSYLFGNTENGEGNNKNNLSIFLGLGIYL